MSDISIYEAIARSLGDVVAKGTPTGATATTMDSNALLHPLANQLLGKEVYIYEGGGAGQSRVIPTFSPGTHRICVEPAWATIPTASSRFLIFGQFKMADYEHAFNRALGKAKLVNLVDMVATSAIVATQYEYPVPSGMEYISGIRIVPSSASDYGVVDDVESVFEFASRLWRIERNVGGSYLICFDARKIDLSNFNAEVVRIQGQGKPDFVATTIPEEIEEFLVADASMQLAAQKRGKGAEWDAMFYMYRDEVKGTRDMPGLESYIIRYGIGKKVKT